MNKLMNKAFLLMCALVMLMAVQAQAHAQAKPGGNSLEIYPHHAAPEDMSLSEHALHRRAIEIAIWSMPLMNYKAMYDSLHEVVGMNYNDVVYP